MSQFARIEQLAQVLEVLQEKLQELLNGQKETQDEVKIVNEKMEKMDGRFGSMEARITATENTVVDKFTVLEQQVAALEAKNPVVELADLSEADHEAFEARVAKKIFSGEIFNSKIESSMNQLEARVINVELEVKTPTHQLDTEVIDNLQEITAGVSASLATKFSTREEIEEIRSQTEAMFGQAARARDADFNNLFKQVQTLNATTEKIVEKQRSVSFASADSSQRVSNLRKKEPGKADDNSEQKGEQVRSPRATPSPVPSPIPSNFSPSDLRGGDSPSHGQIDFEVGDLSTDLSPIKPNARRAMSCREGRYSIMVPQTELRPSQQIHTVTPRSVKMLLNEIYPAYRRISVDQSLNLVDFLSSDVLKLVITRARRQWSSHYWHVVDEVMPNHLSDLCVKEVLCILIRPSGAVQYRELLLKHVERIPKNLDWTFGVIDYDIKISDLVMKILWDIKLFDDYFRFGADSGIIASFPEPAYGKEKQPGVLWLALECFGPYKENFRTLLTPKFLRECQDKDAFIKEFIKINDEWTRRAETYRRQNEQGMPSEKPERIMERISREKTQEGFLKGLSRKTAFDRSKGDLSAYQQQGFSKTRPDHDEGGYDSELEAAVETDKGEIRMVSELPEEYEEAEFKAVVESFNRAERGGSAWSRPQQFPPGRGGMRPPTGRFSQGRGSGAGAGGGQQRAPVCYYNAIHGKCDKGKDCPFSHDPTLAKEWLMSKMKIYSGSPLLPGGQQANKSDPNLQQRYPPKKPDALYQMSPTHFSLSQQPSTGGASACGDDEEED